MSMLVGILCADTSEHLWYDEIELLDADQEKNGAEGAKTPTTEEAVLDKDQKDLEEEMPFEEAFLLATFLGDIDGSRNYGQLVKAIELSDLGQVEKCLKQLVCFPEEKKEDLVTKAQKALAERKQMVSLLKSPKDMARFIAGLVLTGIGGLGIYDLVNGLLAYNQGLPFGSGAAALASCMAVVGLGGGAYLVPEGWNCTIAKGKCDSAQKIKELIENKEVIPLKC